MQLSKARFNFWLNLVLFCDMLIIVKLGLILEYVLPACSGGGLGGCRSTTFLFLTRPEWGSVHFFFAILFLALLLIHLLLHWNWIVFQVKCNLLKKEKNENCDASNDRN